MDMIMFMYLCMILQFWSTCCDEVHDMSLYDVVLSYMHNVGLNDFMMKVFLGMKEVVYVCLVNGKVHVFLYEIVL